MEDKLIRSLGKIASILLMICFIGVIALCAILIGGFAYKMGQYFFM